MNTVVSSYVRSAKSIDLGGTGFFRLVGLLAGACANFAVIAILSRDYGVEYYAFYALMASMLNLLPFADFGIGATMVNATADYRSGALDRMSFQSHFRRASLVTVLVSLAVASLAFLFYQMGLWVPVLGAVGEMDHASALATVVIVSAAVGIPLGLGSRILQGCGKMRVVVTAALIGPIIQLIVIGVCWTTQAPAYLFVLAPCAGYLAVGFLTLALALRSISGDEGSLIGWRLTSPVRVRIAETAVPFFLISIGMVVGFQSHRLLISTFGTVEDVAQYSVVAQFAGPLLAILGVMGQNLWSRYRERYRIGTLRVREFAQHIVLLGTVGAVFALALVVISYPGIRFVSGGSLVVPLATVLAGSVYILVVSVHQPAAMFLMDPRGLWLQVLCVWLSGLVGMVLAISLIPELGAAALYLGLSAGMVALQVIPCIYISVRRISSMEKAVEAGVTV